ncbi:MAG: TolB family protein [Solirubrobacterales bacterium]
MRFRGSLPLLLIVGLTLLLAPAASAQNEIAYECDLDVCLLDPANPGAVTNLSDNGEASYDEKPIWAPDGTKVAFVSDFTATGHGERNVFVMSTTATGEDINLATQITHYSSGNKRIDDLAWSPDGSRIAYTRGTNSGDDSVWVVNADGTTTFPLEIGGTGAKRHPTWSPDSSKIAYAVVKNAPEQIYVTSSGGGIAPPLANGVGHEPVWQPNGSKIAFDAYHSGGFGYIDLHIVNADGSGSPLIVTPSPHTEWTFSAWSPDGGRIAYRSTAASGATVYRVMNADGSGDHPLASPGEGDVRYASWSSDGSRVVYEGALLGDINARNLYIANTDGSGGAQPLTSNGKSRSPSWRVVSSTPQAPPPHPGVEKPKVVWITKRIFVGGGRPTYVASYFCGAPSCSVSTEGKMKGALAAGLRFRPLAAALAKPKHGKKKPPKWLVVGRSKTTIPGGQTRKIGIRINKTGLGILKKHGKAKMKVTLKSTLEGEPGVITESHTVTLVLKKKPNKKRKKH